MQWLLLIGFFLLLVAVNIQHGSIRAMRGSIDSLHERIKRLEGRR